MDLISCIIRVRESQKQVKNFYACTEYVCNLIRVSRSFSVSKLCTYVVGRFWMEQENESDLPFHAKPLHFPNSL